MFRDKMATFLIFDTETNGLGTQRISDFNDIIVEKQPELLQLGYQTHRADGSFIERKDFLVKPDGFQISKESIAIHGIEQAYAEQHGQDLQKVLKVFKADFKKTSYAIGQGVTFDAIVLGASFLKAGIPIDWGFKKNATQRRVSSNPKFITTKGGIVRNWWRSRTKKSMALKHLYGYFSKRPLQGAHNAAVDAAATAYVFFNLLKAIPEYVQANDLGHIDIARLVPYEIEQVEQVIRETQISKYLGFNR